MRSARDAGLQVHRCIGNAARLPSKTLAPDLPLQRPTSRSVGRARSRVCAGAARHSVRASGWAADPRRNILHHSPCVHLQLARHIAPAWRCLTPCVCSTVFRLLRPAGPQSLISAMIGTALSGISDVQEERVDWVVLLAFLVPSYVHGLDGRE